MCILEVKSENIHDLALKTALAASEIIVSPSRKPIGI
jgi:hypothetical protein